MSEHRNKIPLRLKFKRAKNSKVINKFNLIFSKIKPPKIFDGKLSKILFIRNDKIGDAIVTLPVLRDLKLNYPDLKIDVLASKRNKFVFDNCKYIDNVIEFDWIEDTSGERKRKINFLKRQIYDVSVDIVGLKKNIFLGKKISKFLIGPGKLGVLIFYDHYSEDNWVTLKDTDFMTRKIEKVLTKGLGLNFIKRDTKLPLIDLEFKNKIEKSFDIVIHFGTSELRKFKTEKEMEIIKAFIGKKILVIDTEESSNFDELKKQLSKDKNIEFRLFDSLIELAEVCSNSKLLICYDGGQAHFLSQYIRSCVIFGPGSYSLWKPYEFTDYESLEISKGGAHASISKGNYGHIIFSFPIWCNPCFDVGCKSKPCLESIKSKFIIDIINKYCLNNHQ